jgi:hypothetical protein
MTLWIVEVKTKNLNWHFPFGMINQSVWSTRSQARRAKRFLQDRYSWCEFRVRKYVRRSEYANHL